MPLQIVRYSSIYNKKHFSSGNSELDRCLKEQSSQDAKRNQAITYLLVDDESIKGFYTLSSYSISKEIISKETLKALNLSYADIPSTLIGRLAVDKNEQGKGYGKYLLRDALNRAVIISKDVASVAVIVDPIDESANSFYLQFGFFELLNNKKLMIPIKTIEKLALK